MKTTHDERYARQRLIRGWAQERLAAARVLVAGVGALGNEAVKNLALAGVGHLLLLDMDHVERSNLSRTLLFSDADVGAPKVEAAARAVARLNPTVRVTVIHGDIRFVVGLGRLHRCTLALGCLDTLGARVCLNRLCIQAGVPLIESGMWAWGGEVRTFLSPDGACVDCTISPDERADLWQRFSCSGFRRAEELPPAATTITTTAIVGGMLSQEAIRWLCGETLETGQALVYNGMSRQMHITTFPRDPDCTAHVPLVWEQVQRLDEPCATLTARALLAQVAPTAGVPPILHLGRDLLLALECSSCGEREVIGQLQRSFPEEQVICARCAIPRTPHVTSTVGIDDAWADWSLAQLGVTDGDVLAISIGEKVRLVELPHTP